MAKVKPVKWAIGADEPGDLEEFLSNDDIVAKHTPKKGKNKGVTAWPGKGPFKFAVRRLTVKPNRNGDDRVSAMLVLREPKGSDAESWNGYVIFDGFNITEQGTPFLKRFLRALGIEWKDFYSKSKQDDNDPPHLVQIGKVKFESGKDPIIRATVTVKPADDYNDEEHLEIGRYLPADEDEPEDDEPEDDDDIEEEDDDVEEDDDDEDEDEEDDDEDDEDSDDDEDDEDEDEEDDDEDDEDDEDEPDEDEIEELREELDGLKIAALRKRARRNDKKSDEPFETMKKPELIQAILEQELNVPPF